MSKSTCHAIVILYTNVHHYMVQIYSDYTMTELQTERGFTIDYMVKGVLSPASSDKQSSEITGP